MPQMNQMMNSFFGGGFPDPMAGMMMPFGGGMFGNFGSMMGNMNSSMNMMLSGNHPGQSFSSSSTFMSYSSNGPNGQPQVRTLLCIKANILFIWFCIQYFLGI